MGLRKKSLQISTAFQKSVLKTRRALGKNFGNQDPLNRRQSHFLAVTLHSLSAGTTLPASMKNRCQKDIKKKKLAVKEEVHFYEKKVKKV